MIIGFYLFIYFFFFFLISYSPFSFPSLFSLSLSNLPNHRAIKQEPDGKKLTVEDTIKFHIETTQFIEKEIEEARKKKEIVVILTHHSPLVDLGSSCPNHVCFFILILILILCSYL